MAKSKIGLLIGIGAIAGAGYLLLKSVNAGADSEAGGTLGGSDEYGDDSLTNPDNPFARIDPNYQYPSGGADNPYFSVIPEGAVVPTPINPMDGSITSPTPGGTETIYPGGESGMQGDMTNLSGQDATIASPDAAKWYDNPLAQLAIGGALFTAGGIAVEKGIKRFSKPTGDQLYAKGEVKGVKTSENPTEVINKKLGVNSDARMPESEITKAKYTTDSDFSISKSKVSTTGKVQESPQITSIKEKPTVEVTAKGKTTTAKAGEVAGKALVIGHVIDRSFGAFNQYGASYLDYNLGSARPTAGSALKAGAVTGVVATQNIAKDIFNIGTGIVYRPKTFGKMTQEEGTITGLFATERELVLGLKNPKEFISGLTGYGEVKTSLGYDTASSRSSGTVTSAPTYSGSRTVSTPVAAAQPKKTVPSYTPTTKVVTAASTKAAPATSTTKATASTASKTSTPAASSTKVVVPSGGVNLSASSWSSIVKATQAKKASSKRR